MLELKQISKDYQAGDAVVHALKNVSIRFRRHEFVAVLGPSGCGKTTLLRLLKPQAAPHGTKTGEIFFCSENIEKCSEEDTAFNRSQRYT